MGNVINEADEHLQYGIGPYRLLKIGDDPPMRYAVGARDFTTGRILPPNDGYSYMIDHPIYGTVMYDADGRRIIQP